MSTQSSEWQIPEWSAGDRFRKAREARGMSQAELADAIGISPRTLGKYEADKVEPKRPVVLSWALATGVPVEWLLYGVIPTNGPEGPEGHESSGNDVLNVTRTAEVVELHRAARAA